MRTIRGGAALLLLLALLAAPEAAGQWRRGGREAWSRWWSRNREAILASVPRKTAFPVTAGDVEKEIVPALRAAAANEEIHPSVRAAAILALARARGNAEDLDLAVHLVETDPDRLVHESGVLALGLRGKGNEKIRDFLIDVVTDPEEAELTRGFAAVALGLTGDPSPEAFRALVAAIQLHRKDPGNVDLAACAIVGAGLLGTELRAPDLLSWIEKGRVGRRPIDDLLRSHVVVALGRIGDTVAVEPLMGLLRAKGDHTKRSVMVAMGRLLLREEGEDRIARVKKLGSYLRREKDAMTRSFGYLSLGEVGAVGDDKTWKACADLIGEGFVRGDRLRERPFAAIALGRLGRDIGGGGHAGSPEVRKRIERMLLADLLRVKGDEEALAAQALALGFLGKLEEKTVSVLRKLLADPEAHGRLRAMAGTALALVGDAGAAETIRDLLGAPVLDRGLRADLATAAGILGDAKSGEVLLEVANDPDASQFALASVLLALGRMKDGRAIPAMVKILEPGKTSGAYPDLTRTTAAAALGWLACPDAPLDKDRAFSGDNHLAWVRALSEIYRVR